MKTARTELKIVRAVFYALVVPGNAFPGLQGIAALYRLATGRI
jgi:hypothetical protein